MKNIKKVLVNKENGLDPREIAKVVILANKFSSDVKLEYKGYKMDAKSIMGLLSLFIKNGDEVTLSANGIDANEALSQLSNIISK